MATSTEFVPTKAQAHQIANYGGCDLGHFENQAGTRAHIVGYEPAHAEPFVVGIYLASREYRGNLMRSDRVRFSDQEAAMAFAASVTDYR